MKKSPKLKQKQIQELKSVISDNNSSSKEVRRAQAIIMVDNGQDIESISALTGYSRSQIFDFRKNYRNNGLSSIQDKRRKNPKELLTEKQREEIAETVKTKTPKDCDYDSDYWSTGILADFIERRYKVKYKSKTSIYIIFKQARFTFHKPGRIYEQRNEQEVEEWRKTTKIQVQKAIEEPNTVILTADEMSLSTQTTIQKVWLPQGKYPKIEVSSKREVRSIYGFLNIKTGQENAFKTRWQNMYITHDVLGKLRKIYPKEKILLLWDKAPWHKGLRAQQFIRKDGNIETIDFPRAAPNENPQEYVWKNGRSHVSHNECIKDIDKGADEFVNYLNNTKFHYSFLGFKSDFGM